MQINLLLVHQAACGTGQGAKMSAYCVTDQCEVALIVFTEHE